MKIPHADVWLRTFIGASDRWHYQPLSVEICHQNHPSTASNPRKPPR